MNTQEKALTIIEDGLEMARGNPTFTARAIIAALKNVGLVIEEDWKPISEAPRDGTPFNALNIDSEVHVAKYDEHGRLCRRSHQQRHPEKFTSREIDGEEVWVRDVDYAERNRGFDTCWSLWTRGYEFAPAHFSPLRRPPIPSTIPEKESP